MSQKYKPSKIEPDPFYNDILVAKFINQIMQKGKKNLARKIVYGAFEMIKKQANKDPIEIFKKALEKIGPSIEVRPQRVGGATYQVPRDVKGKRKISLAIRWLIGTVKTKKGKPMQEKLSQEIILAAKNEGEAVKKRINVEKMAMANQAFAYLAK